MLFHQALSAHRAGRLDEAEKLYCRLLDTHGEQFPALTMLGALKAERSDFVSSESLLSKALALNPNDAAAQLNYGNVLLALGRLDDAFSVFGKALTLNPGIAEAELNRGSILMLRKSFGEAVTCFDNAIRVNPKLAQAFCNRGQALVELGQFEAALASCDAAVAIDSRNAEFHASRANILYRMKRFDEALSAVDAAILLQPANPAFQYNRGNVCFQQKRFDEAFAAFGKATAIDKNFADAHYNEGFARLLLGDTERGWRKYEYRWDQPDRVQTKRHFRQPIWLGEGSLEGKTILIHAEQGFGDTIMASRFVPLVAALGAQVILEVQAALVPLMQRIQGVSGLVIRGETLPDFDVHCPFMSLPFAFRTTLKTIPNRVPYLDVPQEKIERWRARLGDDDLKVGIAWAGNASFKDDRDRSILLTNILPICSAESVKFFSLQKDLRSGDAETLLANPQIVQLGSELNDFEDTAAAMLSLDLIISSDTAVVHLAGALGLPVWVLLSHIPDWRWLLDRSDSPWYPTARLFRQDERRQWKIVTEEVIQNLKKFVADRKNTKPDPGAAG